MVRRDRRTVYKSYGVEFWVHFAVTFGICPHLVSFSMEYSEDEGDASLGWGYEVGSRCLSGWWLGLEIVSTNYDVVRTMCKIS